jgi:hypothetical protein
MKKLLGIVVLGLLLSGCASQETKQKQRLNSHMVGVELVKKGFNSFFHGYGKSYLEAMDNASKLCEVKRKKIGEGRCKVAFNCNSKGYNCAGGSNAYVPPAQKDKNNSQISLASIKSKCIQFGYKEGSEKLADCMKELYIKNSQAGTAKRKIDPSVWDDIIDLSTGVMNGSSKSKTPRQVCFRTGQEKIGFGKSCRYSCTGSLYTMMVGSLEMCPLTVER